MDEPADTEPSSTSADNDASLPSTSVDMAPSSHGEIEEATADETIPPEAESVQDGVDQHEEITTNLIDDETPATLEAAPSGANETTLEEAAPESEVVPEATTSDIAQDNGGDINDASSEKNSEDGNAPIEEEQPEVVVLQEQPEQPATDLLENNPDNNTGPIVDSSVSDAVLQQEDPQSTGDHLPAIKEPDSNPPKESIETGEEVSQSLEQSSLAGQQETEQIQSPGDAADEELDAVAPSRDDIEDEKPEPDPQTTLDVADEKLEPEPKPVSPPADDVKDEEPESVSHATSDVVDKDAELEPPSQPTDDVKVEESQSVPQATGDVKEEEPLASTEEVRDEAMPQPEQPPTEPDVAVEPAQQPDIDAAKDVIVESTAEPEVDPVIVEPQTKGESDPSDEAVVQAPTEEIPVVEESKGPSVPSAPAEAASEAKLKEDQDEARDKLAEMSTPEGRKGKTESRIIPLGGTAPGVLMFQSRERRHESVVEGIYPRDQVISQGVDGDACQEKLADGHWITTGLPQDLDPAANEPRTSNLEDTEPFEHLDSSTSRGQSSVAQDIEKSMLEKDVIKPLPQDSNPLHKYNIRPDNIDTCMAGEPRSTISNATQPTEVPPQIESSTKQGNVLAPSDDASKVEKVDPPAPKELAQSASNGQISDISARDDPEATSLADHPTASVQELIVPQTLDMAEPSVSGKLEGEVIDANEGISEGDRNTPISEATTTLAESDSLLLPTTFDQGKGILDGETLNAQRQTSELVTPTENAGNHRGLVAGIATAAATVMTGAGTLVQKLSTGTELNNLPQQPLTNSLGLSPARSVYKRPSKTVRQLSSNFEAESLASSSDIPAVPPKSPERGSSPDAATRDSTREFETHAAQSQELSDLPAELNQTSIMSQSSPSKTSLRGHRQVNAAYSPSGRAPTDQKQTEPEVTIKGTGIRLTSALFGTQIVEDFGSNTIRNFGLANSQGFSDTRSSTPGIVLPDPTDPKAKALGRAKSLRRSRRRTLRSNEETVAAAVIIYATARELSPTSDTRLGSAHPGSSSPEIEEYGSRLGTSMAQGVAESRGVDMVNVDDLVTDSSTDDEGKRSGSDRHRRHRHSSSRSGETRSSDTKKDSQHRSRRESNASSVSATSDLFVGSKTTKRTDSGFSVDSSRSSRPQKTPEEQAAHEKRRAERRAERTPEEQALHEKHKEERRALREKEREREKLTEREPEGKGKGKGAELPQGDLPSHRSSRRYSQRSSSTRSEGAPRNDEPSTAPDRRSSELKAPNFLSRASEPAVSRASKDAPRPETARRSHTSKETSRKSNNAPQDREHRSSRGHHQHRHRDRSPSDKVKPPPRPANDVEADIPRSSKSVREPKESRDERPHRREERQKVRDAEAKKKQAPSGFKGMIKKIFA